MKLVLMFLALCLALAGLLHAEISQGSQTLYDLLGTEQTVSSEEVKAVYRKLARQWHPDKNPERREEATVKFQAIQEAYETLSDEEKRRKYDMILRGDSFSSNDLLKLHQAIVNRMVGVVIQMREDGYPAAFFNTPFTDEHPSYVGFSPLQVAFMRGNFDVVLELMRCGADRSVRDAAGNTLLHLAVQLKMFGADYIAIIAERFGIDINAVNDAGNTAFHCAAAAGDTTTMVRLYAYGVDRSLRNAQGQTAADLYRETVRSMKSALQEKSPSMAVRIKKALKFGSKQAEVAF